MHDVIVVGKRQDMGPTWKKLMKSWQFWSLGSGLRSPRRSHHHCRAKCNRFAECCSSQILSVHEPAESTTYFRMKCDVYIRQGLKLPCSEHMTKELTLLASNTIKRSMTCSQTETSSLLAPNVSIAQKCCFIQNFMCKGASGI